MGKIGLWRSLRISSSKVDIGYRIGYGYDILKSLKIGYYILKISCSKKG
jgi:hypothetical protein